MHVNIFIFYNDVKRGKNLEAEAKNNYEKKYQIMINDIRFKIIAGKIKNKKAVLSQR